MYKKEIKHLKILFTQLKQPLVTKAEMPKDASAIDETLSQEEVRQYSKDKKSPETTVPS